MLSYLINSGSLAAIISEKGQNKVLKFEGKIGSVSLLKVQLALTRSYQVVKVLVSARFLKGENTLHYNKKHHSEREQVDFLSTVSSTLFYLGGHVGECASKALKVVDVFVAGKTEVSDFEIKVVVDQDILKF